MVVPAAMRANRNSGKTPGRDEGRSLYAPPLPARYSQKIVSSNKMLRTEVEILFEVVYVFRPTGFKQKQAIFGGLGSGGPFAAALAMFARASAISVA
jgi:hypothetical protein